jgi:hypothetical protein
VRALASAVALLSDHRSVEQRQHQPHNQGSDEVVWVAHNHRHRACAEQRDEPRKVSKGRPKNDDADHPVEPSSLPGSFEKRVRVLRIRRLPDPASDHETHESDHQSRQIGAQV